MQEFDVKQTARERRREEEEEGSVPAAWMDMDMTGCLSECLGVVIYKLVMYVKDSDSVCEGVSQLPAACIISTAQHAKPNVMGHNDPLRAQFTKSSTLDTTNSASCIMHHTKRKGKLDKKKY